MERKNRNILVVLIAAVIAIAVLASFGLNLFTTDLDIIPLPEPLSDQDTSGDNQVDEDGTGLVRVAVTPSTVQGVIGTMTRPESYYRTVILEDFWGTQRTSITTAQVWVDAGWTHTIAEWENGLVRTSIVGDNTLWWWYQGDATASTAPADENSADLEGQRIPTYEEILEVDERYITDANYEERGGLSCIYIETENRTLGYTLRYWVSVESGLLVAMETWRGEELLSTMESYEVERPVPANVRFVLPNGEVLHTTGTAS